MYQGKRLLLTKIAESRGAEEVKNFRRSMNLKFLKWGKYFKFAFFPKIEDRPIQTVVEFVVYLCIFTGLLWAYVKCNQIPYLNEKIQATIVNNGDVSVKFGSFKVDYIMPMTTEAPLQNLSPNAEVILKAVLEPGLGNDYQNQQLKTKFDSLCRVLSVKDKDFPCLFYARREQTVRKPMGFAYVGYKQDWACGNVESKMLCRYEFDRKEYKETNESFSWLDSESVNMNDAGFLNTEIVTKSVHPQGWALGDPGWFALEDISQGYYQFKFDLPYMKFSSLKIDFVGATEFSNMTPEPDKVTMGGIEFTDKDKMTQLILKGLLFHVKHKELQNRQTIRMFFLTAILSGMLMVLIAFVILWVLKVVKYRVNANNKETK